MAEARGESQAPALRDRAGGWRAVRLCRAVGALEAPGRRLDPAQLRDRDRHAQLALRADPRPDAGDPAAGGLADLAWRSRGQAAGAAGTAPSLSGRADARLSDRPGCRPRQEWRTGARRTAAL